MKTSSKLLIGALTFGWLFGASIMLAIRANIDEGSVAMSVGNNVISSQEFVVDTFQNVKRIRVQGPYNIKLSNAESLGIKMEADETLLDNLSFFMEDDILKIDRKTDVDSFNVLNLHIAAPPELQLALVGWGNISSKEGFQTNWLALDGDGEVNVSLQSEALYLNVRGRKVVTLEGDVKLLNLNGRGEQHLYASGLAVGEAVVMQTKNFHSTLHVSDRLIIADNDNSTIEFLGAPEVMEPLYRKGTITHMDKQE
ncbi:MAG: DUF2807 domain-containing protein [Bacteroidota bacterium]